MREAGSTQRCEERNKDNGETEKQIFHWASFYQESKMALQLCSQSKECDRTLSIAKMKAKLHKPSSVFAPTIFHQTVLFDFPNPK